MPIEQSREPEQFADFELAGNIAGYDAAFGALGARTCQRDYTRMTAASLSFLALARWDWMTADEIVAASLLLMLFVVAIWANSRSKKTK